MNMGNMLKATCTRIKNSMCASKVYTHSLSHTFTYTYIHIYIHSPVVDSLSDLGQGYPHLYTYTHTITHTHIYIHTRLYLAFSIRTAKVAALHTYIPVSLSQHLSDVSSNMRKDSIHK